MINLMDSRRGELEQAIAGAQQGLPLLVGGDADHPVLIGVSDDRGLYAFVTLLCDSFGISLQQGVDLLLVGSLAIGLTAAAVCLMLLVRTWLSRGVILLGLLILAAQAIRVGDVYIMSAAATGVFPLLLLCRQKAMPWLVLVLLGAGVGLFLGVTQVVRSHAATPLVLMALPLLFYRAPQSLLHRTALVLPGVIAFVGLLLWFGHIRDQAESFVRDHSDESISTVTAHPFWHSVYIGIGFRENPWGVRYQDQDAAAAVAAVDPDIIYCSPEYEAVLRDKVFAMFWQHPVFIVQTAFAKLGVVLFYLLLFANVGLLAAWWRPHEPAVLVAVCLGLAFNSLFGVLVYPLESYCMGFIAIAAIFGIWSLCRAIDYACGHSREHDRLKEPAQRPAS